MNLYLDENRAGPRLTTLLRKAGHQVVQPADIGMQGKSDARQLERAICDTWVLLTADGRDFWELHELVLASGGHHPGILVIRYENNPKRDMTTKDIVTAVGKLERAGAPVVDVVTILNQWR